MGNERAAMSGRFNMTVSRVAVGKAASFPTTQIREALPGSYQLPLQCLTPGVGGHGPPRQRLYARNRRTRRVFKRVNESLKLDAASERFYRRAMHLLREHEIPFLLGGAYALCVYTGLTRHTKDIDFFLRTSDVDRTLALFEQHGFLVEKTFPHWLAKIHCGENFADLIYASGNGLCEVDGSWFERAQAEEFLGQPVKVLAPEEIIWMKGFVQERERFDGADIVHLIQSCAEGIDWNRLRDRFGRDWRVLYGHLVFFGYVFPSERHRVPLQLLREMGQRLEMEGITQSAEKICRGTLLSRAQYLPDVNERGYRDARLEPRTTMDKGDVAYWTAAIDEEKVDVPASCE